MPKFSELRTVPDTAFQNREVNTDPLKISGYGDELEHVLILAGFPPKDAKRYAMAYEYPSPLTERQVGYARKKLAEFYSETTQVYQLFPDSPMKSKLALILNGPVGKQIDQLLKGDK